MSLARPLACPLLFAALMLATAGCSSTPNNDSTDPSWRDGETAFLNGKWAGAISAYERFIGAHPDDARVPEARLWIGRAYLGENRPANAMTFIDQVLSSSPSDPLNADAHAARGMAQLMLGNPQRAEPDFMDALRIGGDRVRRDECLYFLGVSKIRQGHWDDGLGDLGVLIRQTPDSPYAAKARALRNATERVFSVQAGAFDDPAGARRQADALRQKGFDSTIVPEGTLNCVRVGKFATWREANDQAQAIQATGIEAAVVP